jgi:hypothetical protein
MTAATMVKGAPDFGHASLSLRVMTMPGNRVMAVSVSISTKFEIQAGRFQSPMRRAANASEQRLRFVILTISL